MYSLFQNRSILIVCFVVIQFFSVNAFADKHIFIKGRPLTAKESSKINSEIKRISYQGPVESVSFIEAKGSRIYLYGYLNNIPIVAIQFCMEIGDGVSQYLMIFDRKNQKILSTTKIGGSGFRKIAIYNIGDGILACATFYGPKDPMPDPSVNGNVTFYLGQTGAEEYYTTINDPNHPAGCTPQ